MPERPNRHSEVLADEFRRSTADALCRSNCKIGLHDLIASSIMIYDFRHIPFSLNLNPLRCSIT